jgi:phosphatidylglycerol lysyltransferase
VGGAILLLSGATPAVKGRLAWLHDFLPLPIVEVSHFLGSLAGVALLVLARGLQRRLDVAYHLTLAVLAAGAVFSLLKGADYEEAGILTAMLVALLPSRRYFYRKASLLQESFSLTWLVSIAAVVFASLWLGFFAYKHVEYTSELWWRFALFGDAPRFLRASVGVVVVLLGVSLARLLRAAPAPSPRSSGDAVAEVATIVAASEDAAANLAFLGDKSFLISASGHSFVMYATSGRSWVAMGDPMGREEEGAELVWEFRELSDRHGGWTVFYEVGRKNLHLYLELGLMLLKLGEEARVPLADFTLEGGGRKGLRYQLRKLEKEGASFEVAPSERVPALLPELRAISDRWLQGKRAREKGFSLGRFDEAYLRHFPVALVRDRGRLVAFANIWASAAKHELSVDLMRHLPDAPAGVMDYLFTSLLLWGKAEGYASFSLGMAPFAGLPARQLAPLWSRLGALVFRHGEHFYNFQGLRAYKNKFDPEWSPRYLASPGGLALPAVLSNVAALVSGSVMGALRK